MCFVTCFASGTIRLFPPRVNPPSRVVIATRDRRGYCHRVCGAAKNLRSTDSPKIGKADAVA